MGATENAIILYLHRHPELRPAMQYGGTFIWTEEEIEALWKHRMRPISRGPHAKKGTTK
jgi:hypothetical protein